MRRKILEILRVPRRSLSILALELLDPQNAPPASQTQGMTTITNLPRRPKDESEGGKRDENRPPQQLGPSRSRGHYSTVYGTGPYILGVYLAQVSSDYVNRAPRHTRSWTRIGTWISDRTG